MKTWNVTKTLKANPKWKVMIVHCNIHCAIAQTRRQLKTSGRRSAPLVAQKPWICQLIQVSMDMALDVLSWDAAVRVHFHLKDIVHIAIWSGCHCCSCDLQQQINPLKTKAAIYNSNWILSPALTALQLLEDTHNNSSILSKRTQLFILPTEHYPQRWQL